MSDPNTADPPAESGNTTAQAPASSEAPEWAVSLKRTLDELPGKLKASISDDDKSGIAEAVHGLFERSGAFEAGPSSVEQEADTATDEAEEGEQKVEHEAAPKKGNWLSGLAAKFAGDND